MIQVFDRNRYLKIMELIYVGCDSTIRNDMTLRGNISYGMERKCNLFFFFFYLNFIFIVPMLSDRIVHARYRYST